MSLLSAMADVGSSVQRRFTQNVVKLIFVLSPGYATVPEPPSICVHDGHNDRRGTVQRDNTRTKQNGGPQQLLPIPIRASCHLG